MMQDIMDRFNEMVRSLTTLPDLAHVRFIDLRGTLSNRLADYKDWWANELHPTGEGFKKLIHGPWLAPLKETGYAL